MNMTTIYMDHAATTPIHPEVIETITTLGADVFGNPSSIHSYGRDARKYMNEARDMIAQSIQAKDQEIIFTSGGTEANNLAIIGVALANKHKGKHIITTEIEHDATLHAVQYLEKQGFKVTYLPVNEHGKVAVNDVVEALTPETILVSIMYVNNETGVKQPIRAIGELLKAHQAYFHTDAVQAYGLLSIDVEKLGIDLMSVSAHKINGPKGIGFLYAKEDIQMQPLFFGGEQERKKRPGTENVIGVLGFQRAVERIVKKRIEIQEAYSSLQSAFINALSEKEVEFKINGRLEDNIGSIINLSFPGTQVESLLTNLDLEKIAASSGSACTAGSLQSSHVLVAMYQEDSERIHNSIRFCFGYGQTIEQMEEAAERIARIVKRLKT